MHKPQKEVKLAGQNNDRVFIIERKHRSRIRAKKNLGESINNKTLL